MTSSTRKPASQSLIGIKMFVIAASLSGTLFGWAVLAVGQLSNGLANQSSPIFTQSGTTNNPVQNSTRNTQQQSPVLRSVSGPFQPVARSRSSR